MTYFARGSADWAGGVIAQAQLDTQKGSVDLTVLVPGQDAPRTCALSVTSGTETLQPTANSLKDGAVAAMATSAHDPQLALAYSVTTEASGLEPRSTDTFVQTVNPTSCALGERIPVADDLEDPQTMGFVGFDDTTLVLGVEDGKGDARFVGLDPASGKAAWTADVDGTAFFPEAVAQYPGILPMNAEIEGQGGTHVLDTATGKELVSADASDIIGFSPEIVPLAEGRLATFSTTGIYIVEDGRTTPLIESRHGFQPSERAVGTDDQGKTIVVLPVGARDTQGKTATSLSYVSNDGLLKQIVDAETTERLDLTPQGVQDGKIRARTTDQIVTIDVSGNTVAEPTSNREVTWKPERPRAVGDSQWYVWTPSGAGDSSRALSPSLTPPANSR